MITLKLQTFYQRDQGGNVTGVIFLESQGRAFPERGWFDFPVIILGWWIDAWLQLEVPTRREVQWHFMDGPYVATLRKSRDAALHSAQVRRYLLEAAERVVAHCEQNGMTSRDLELLRSSVDNLKASQPSAADSGFAVHFACGRRRL